MHGEGLEKELKSFLSTEQGIRVKERQQPQQAL